MIETMTVTKTITVPADQAWRAIVQIDGLDRWFPVIVDCVVIGSGVGATRVLSLPGGEKITDRIEAIDHQARRFQYNRIESPFPVKRYLGTVEVYQSGPRSSEIAWTVEIEVDNEQREELTVFLRQALADGIDGLEQDLAAQTSSRPA